MFESNGVVGLVGLDGNKVASLLIKVDVNSELRTPAVKCRPAGRPITGGPLHLLWLRGPIRNALWFKVEPIFTHRLVFLEVRKASEATSDTSWPRFQG